MTTGGLIDEWLALTPIGSSTNQSATGNGGKDCHLCTIIDGCIKAILEADVLAAHVDVDEAAQVAVLGNSLAQLAVRLEDGIEHLADGLSRDLHLGLPSGRRAELGRDLHGDCHHKTSRVAR